MTKTNSKRKNLAVVLFIAMIVLIGVAIYFNFILQKMQKTSSDKSQVPEKVYRNEDELTWERYVNEEYGITFERPKFLNEEVQFESGGFELFAAFTPTQYSESRLVTIGISENTLNKEIDRVIGDLESSFEIEKISEKDIEVDGKEAKRFDYEPLDLSEYEPRTFVFFYDGTYTYSIGTVPQQIDRIIRSFSFN